MKIPPRIFSELVWLLRNVRRSPIGRHLQWFEHFNGYISGLRHADVITSDQYSCLSRMAMTAFSKVSGRRAQAELSVSAPAVEVEDSLPDWDSSVVEEVTNAPDQISPNPASAELRVQRLLVKTIANGPVQPFIRPRPPFIGWRGAPPPSLARDYKSEGNALCWL